MKHKHKFRQKFRNASYSVGHDGYYCQYCLLEVNDKKDLEVKDKDIIKSN